MIKVLVGMVISCAIYAQSNQVTLTAVPPSSSTQISATVVGNQGNTTSYYWVVAHFPIGEGANASYGQVIHAPDSLSGSNYVSVTWAGVTGALNYDLLKTSTPAIPTTCTCSLVIGTSSTTYNDTGGSLSSYSYIPTSVANGSIILDNVDYSLARLLINKPVNVTNYSGIPPASLGNKYNVYLVIDSASGGDCTAGGGSDTPTLCMSNGVTYIALGGGGGSGTIGGKY